MRIVYVTETYPPELNGVALTAERAVSYLRACGHDVMLVRPQQPGEHALDNAREWRTEGFPIPMYPSLRFGVAVADDFRRRWADAPPDVVHVATPGPLALAALRAARADDIATSADFRTNFHAYCSHYGIAWGAPLVRSYLRWLHGKADLTFAPTRQCRRALRALGVANVQVAGRGVDAHHFSPVWRDERLREHWGAGIDDPVLLHVGRLAFEKNVTLALGAFEEARRRQPRARMVVVGDGPERAALEAAFPRVRFVGEQRGDALARHYASADLFLFPSTTDTFGNVVLEAMASGLAVVAFDLAAAHDHLRDEDNGFLAHPQSPSAFAIATLRALGAASPASPERQRARRCAVELDWPGALAPFERRLCDVATARLLRRPLQHAAVA